MNLFLVTALTRIRHSRDREPERFDLSTDALGPDPRPDYLYVYLIGLATAWSVLVPIVGLPLAGLAFVGDRLGGRQVDRIGIPIFVFVLVFFIAGSCDAVWRSWVANAARRRYNAADWVLDDETRRLVRIARLNDGTIVLQLVIAAYIAWRAS